MLLVEDEVPMLRTLARALADLGLAVEAVSDARAALVVLQTRRLDAVLSDFSLPPHEDGAWLLEQAQRLQPEARRYLMSGSEHGSFESLLARGVVEQFFLKPPDPAALVEALVEPAPRRAHG